MKRRLCLFLASAMLLSLVGCGSDNEEKSGVSVYRINASGDGLVSESTEIGTEYSEGNVNSIIDEISKAASDEEDSSSSVLQNGLTVASYNYNSEVQRFDIDLSGDYGSLTNAEKLMLMAGLTLSFEQLDGVDSVYITIQGEPLLDSNGNDIKSLQTDDFVIHSGNEVNIYTSAEMKLYFLDLAGKKLAPETRTVYFNSNVPLEQVVLDEIIKGPQDTASRSSSVPSTLTYLSVTTQDGVCYVNFDENAVQAMALYDSEMALESIVESIASVCNVQKVQFLINGDTSVEFSDGTSIDHIYNA